MDCPLEATTRHFIETYRDADLLEAVIDTSVGGPYLNLWACRVHDGADLDDALRQVNATGDGGFLEAIVDELDSSSFQIRLAQVYPHWPDDLEQGDRTVIRLLDAASAGLPATTRVLFHHVDVWPAVVIRG